MFESFVTAGKKPLIAVAESKIEAIPAKLRERWRLLTKLNKAPEDTFKDKGLSTLQQDSLSWWGKIKAFFHLGKIRKGKGTQVEDSLAQKIRDAFKPKEPVKPRPDMTHDIDLNLRNSGNTESSRVSQLLANSELADQHPMLNDIDELYDKIQDRVVSEGFDSDSHSVLKKAMLEAFPDGGNNATPDELKTGMRQIAEAMNRHWKSQGIIEETIPSSLLN